VVSRFLFVVLIDTCQFNICREHPLGHDSPDGESRLAVKSRTAEEVAAECGSLGVMVVPAGADPANVSPNTLSGPSSLQTNRINQYRKCRDHPSGHNLPEPVVKPLSERELSESYSAATPLDARFVKRACWFGRSIGCSKDGWCFKRCGSPLSAGKWCWTASKQGNGPWAKCSVDSQCNVTELDCGGACSC